tara:strand:+ start:145 stop:354 length:210 start_codon:yes stop_codon:yes gene_type:complete
VKKILFCLLLISGCSSVPTEEKAELDKYTRPLGDKVWYCESRGGRAIKTCGWADRRSIEKAINSIYGYR